MDGKHSRLLCFVSMFLWICQIILRWFRKPFIVEIYSNLRYNIKGKLSFAPFLGIARGVWDRKHLIRIQGSRSNDEGSRLWKLRTG